MSIRKEMEAILKSGKSVLYGGVSYNTIEELPSEAELAKGNAAMEKIAKENIKAEMKRLSDELSLMDDDKEDKEVKEDKEIEKAGKSSDTTSDKDKAGKTADK